MSNSYEHYRPRQQKLLQGKKQRRGFGARDQRILAVYLLALLISFFVARSSEAYITHVRWSKTALGTTSTDGKPATLTWGFIADGTPIENRNSTSNLLAFFDEQFGVTDPTDDLTARSWFPLFEQALDRWSAVSGLTFR